MFNVQRSIDNHEIYVNYNEYLYEEGDEYIGILEHMAGEGFIKDFDGIIDLITLRKLKLKDAEKIKSVYYILKKGNVSNLYIVSDNKKVLRFVKKLIPDIPTKLIKVH
ncbi:hypothetical protein OXPF_00690 [Oxobacter pfennigii]|uniref:Uncharacterized protein n=1 Tax=Oxobacter pfennigii TaxID=36849 RepID=A0A0P9ALR6_9CLOT|nr:hypothetical protein [Oxobacter pfennigii]KPU46341.1 hypothetical protein OXPF_00690 [Oxobacter pfennigii]